MSNVEQDIESVFVELSSVTITVAPGIDIGSNVLLSKNLYSNVPQYPAPQIYEKLSVMLV